VAITNSSAGSKLWLIIALLFTFSIGILLGIKLQTQETISVVETTKIEEILRFTESWYVDKVDRKYLLQKATQNIVNNKTTFSQKVTSPALEKLMLVINKNFEGSGTDATIFADTLLLIKPTTIGNGLIYKPY